MKNRRIAARRLLRFSKDRIGAIEEAYGLQPRLQAAQFYTPDFLPPVADRRI